MKKKKRFMQAVQILAPSDQFIFEAAQRIPAEKLPPFPGAAALEFVVAVLKLREPVNSIPINAFSGEMKSASPCPTSTKHQLSLAHALRIESAKYWLKLGEPDEALRELEALPANAWNHPSAVKARVAAVGALRERSQVSQVTVQEESRRSEPQLKP